MKPKKTICFVHYVIYTILSKNTLFKWEISISNYWDVKYLMDAWSAFNTSPTFKLLRCKEECSSEFKVAYIQKEKGLSEFEVAKRSEKDLEQSSSLTPIHNYLFKRSTGNHLDVNIKRLQGWLQGCWVHELLLIWFLLGKSN